MNTSKLFLAVLLACLLLTGPTYAADPEVKIPISGASLMWKKILQSLGTPITTAFQNDFTTAIGALGTVAVAPLSDADVNATALFVTVTVTLTPPATEEQAVAALRASTLSDVNTLLVTSQSTFSSYSDVYPKDVRPTTPLFPNPNPVVEADLTMAERWVATPPVNTYTSEQAVVLSGATNAQWNAANKDSINTLLYTAIESDVTDLRPYVLLREVGVSTEVRGDTLLAKLKLEQGVIKPALGTKYNMFDAVELSSVITMVDPATVLSGATVRLDTAVDYRNVHGLECTAGCVGMIITGAVVGGLTLVTFVVTLILVCCCIPKEEKSYAAPARSGAREVDDVYSNPYTNVNPLSPSSYPQKGVDDTVRRDLYVPLGGYEYPSKSGELL